VYYFALDLADAGTAEPRAVFFDTYEALAGEMTGIGDPL
jgi:hypothetical protein